MTHRPMLLTLVVLTFIASGCEKKMVAPSSGQRGMSALAGFISPKVMAQEQSQRFIAERNTFNVATPASQLQNAWGSTVAFCATIQCQVISSNITVQTSESAPSGNVSMRVAPGDLQNLINRVQSVGKILQHNTEREDETAFVVDTDAKIKNLTAFRDNLRAMLAKPNLSVDNLVEINKQLTDTQAYLDSQAAQRKILANKTEKIAVDISFSAQASGSTGVLADIWNALLDAGATLLGSVATLITVVIFLIPWIVLLFVVVWLVIKLRRRSRQRHTPPTPQRS